MKDVKLNKLINHEEEKCIIEQIDQFYQRDSPNTYSNIHTFSYLKLDL